TSTSVAAPIVWPDGKENERSTPATTIDASGGRGRATTALSTVETSVDSTIAPANMPGSHHVPERQAHSTQPSATRTGSTYGPDTVVTTVRTVVATGERCATIHASRGSSSTQRSSWSRTASSRTTKPTAPTRTSASPGHTRASTSRADAPPAAPPLGPMPGGYAGWTDHAGRPGGVVRGAPTLVAKKPCAAPAARGPLGAHRGGVRPVRTGRWRVRPDPRNPASREHSPCIP